MGKWAYTLDIATDYKRAESREINPVVFAGIIADKLLKIAFKSQHADSREQAEQVAFEFREFAEQWGKNPDAADWDAFDEVLEMLYDWGDQVLEGSDVFDRVRTCWVRVVK